MYYYNYYNLDAAKRLELFKLHGGVTFDDVLADESLLDKYVYQHSYSGTYDELYEYPCSFIRRTEKLVRDDFYKEKARLQTEHIKSLCSLLRELIKKKENS